MSNSQLWSYPVIVVMCLIVCIACSNELHDYHFYRMHPEKIQAAWQVCLNNTINHDQCQAVRRAGEDTQRLMVFFIKQPQVYGQRILTLQMQIAKEQALYKELQSRQQTQLNDKERALLQQLPLAIKNYQTRLKYRLVIIRVLTSMQGG